MSDPYTGEIRLFAGTYAPVGWLLCNGAQVSIAEYSTLFALIGTTYGGDGVNTFALPDLRGRLPISQGQGPGLSNYVLGEVGGVEQVTLDASQIPAHTHALNATSATGSATAPDNTLFLATPVEQNVTTSLYVVPGTSVVNLAPMVPASIGNTGNGQPHSNMMPTLAINYIMAYEGIYPSQN